MPQRIAAYIPYFILHFLFLSLDGEAQSCNPPLLTSIDSISPFSFKLSWIDFNGDVTGWEIEYGEKDFERTTGIKTGIIVDRSLMIKDLLPGTTYQIYLRTICDGGNSNWTGPFDVNTAILNTSSCFLQLAIDDNNCPKKDDFYVYEDRFTDLILGKDVFIQSIDLVIEHDWPADLKVELVNPSGNSVVLSANIGIGLDNYGNPQDTLCKDVLSFSDFACESIQNQNPNALIGTFFPEEKIEKLYDETSVNGNWVLKICDRAQDDRGVLKYVRINFSEIICNVPTDIAAVNIDRNSADIIWRAPEECEVSVIHIVDSGKEPGSGIEIFTSCQSERNIVNDLSPETTYDLYIQSICGNIESAFSCVYTFTTACDSVALVSSFDEKALCDPSCVAPCKIQDSVWKNVQEEDEQDWIVYNTNTPTELTGPNSDISGFGNYIYHEASPELCGVNSRSILETRCLFISNNDGDCGMSFYHLLRGDDSAKLTLLINSEESNHWDTLYFVESSQKTEWERVFIDLSNYQDRYATLRFIGMSGSGDLSDIGIDQIEFYNSQLSDSIPSFYLDLDQDGFGNIDSILSLCINNPPEGYVRLGGDCNDEDPEINPAQQESACNLIDDDCNGLVDDVIIENPIIVEQLDFTNESCPGSKDGSITIEVKGGVSPYLIRWNNGEMGNHIKGLSDGVYIAEITDALGCSIKSDFYDIDVMNSPEIFVRSVLNTTCRRSLGEITIEVAGGDTPYNYSWSNGSNAKNQSELGEGNYVLTVTDANGCEVVSQSIPIIATPRFTSGVQLKRDLRCQGDNDGLISIGVINALEPVKYLWSHGDSTSFIRNLSEGLYTVTINDGRGCEDILSIPIVSPPQLEAKIIGIEQISCYGGSDGSIQVSTAGGVAPYSFNWNTLDEISLQSSFNEDISSLSRGDYFLIVNDSNGCKDTTDIITVVDPTPINIDIVDVRNVSCRFSQDGGIKVSASGGNEGFQYFWSNGGKGSDLENISTGTYSIRVIDQLGCKAGNNGLDVNIQNVPLMLSYAIEDINLCSYDSNGIISVQVETKGKAPFDFNWSSGTQRIKNINVDSIKRLPSGLYSVTVTDNEGCVGNAQNILIPDIKEMVVDSIIKQGNICNIDSNGSITLITSGGTPPYNYQWKDGVLNRERKDLVSGIYSVDIFDANACLLTIDTILIPSDFELIIQSKTINPGFNQNDGEIELIIEKGKAPYKVTWDHSSSTDLVLKNLTSGNYCVSIEDGNSCLFHDCYQLTLSTGISENRQKKMEIYPNPSKNLFIVKFEGDVRKLEIFTSNGQKVNSASYNKKNSTIDLGLEQAGIYFIRVISDIGVYSSKVVKL